MGEKNCVFIRAFERFPRYILPEVCSECFAFWLVERSINWLLKLQSSDINELAYALSNFPWFSKTTFCILSIPQKLELDAVGETLSMYKRTEHSEDWNVLHHDFSYW